MDTLELEAIGMYILLFLIFFGTIGLIAWDSYLETKNNKEYICEYCGSKLSYTAHFCNKCGAPIK